MEFSLSHIFSVYNIKSTWQDIILRFMFVYDGDRREPVLVSWHIQLALVSRWTIWENTAQEWDIAFTETGTKWCIALLCNVIQ